MNQFFNPKSMLTPGAAGALIMLITNALCNNFPEFHFRYVALILSFVIGAVVFTASTMKVWERGIYWVVNSLIIFSMGVGATNIAANVSTKQASNEYQPLQPEHQYKAIPLPESDMKALEPNETKQKPETESKVKVPEPKETKQKPETESKVKVPEQIQKSFFRKW
ncbi:MAG: hypothetical protein Q8O92_11165 [Candidatus Latescibacter sp.]|nr:hypothetical protein [Candidatus Latescibacter sp.]